MTTERIVQIAVPIVTAIVGAVAGGSGASIRDVTGAKAFVEAEAAKIAEAERLEARVIALEAQQTILIQLVERCGSR